MSVKIQCSRIDVLPVKHSVRHDGLEKIVRLSTDDSGFLGSRETTSPLQAAVRAPCDRDQSFFAGGFVDSETTQSSIISSMSSWTCLTLWV